MAHKVHPKSYRIKGIEDWSIRGFYGKKMAQRFEEDFLIMEFLKKKLADASVANVEIEHSANKINIIIYTAKPGFIIGRGGEGIEKLKEMIQKKMTLGKVNTKKKSALLSSKESVRNTSGTADARRPARSALHSDAGGEIKIEIREIKNPWLSAVLVGQMVAQQIEKRIPFRQVLKRTIERVISNKEIKGVKVEVSGRLNGVEIARREWLRQGRLPLQTLRADIDYVQTQAYCTYGVIGIKVWIYKGDKFE